MQRSTQHPEQQYQEISAPVIKLVEKIFEQAISKNASDIHFEPYANHYRIRLRIDGILYPIMPLDSSLALRINSRLKILARLNIAERRLPQDGRFNISGRDCRISSCPTMFGEKIVVRILNPTNLALETAQIGLTTQQQKIFLEHVSAPQGMILVSGATGSGKTVTLYTALTLLNTDDRNISTVEDPIEINLPGINQVEINPKIGLDFAAILRTFLRQDPDIIMVGEIRDFETAQIAIKAAQTGHLVLSTLHANSASETITRLLNMNIASFNLVGTIKLLIAQRLVRKLCPHCKVIVRIPGAALNEAGISNINNHGAHDSGNNNGDNRNSTLELFQANRTGCSKCKNGYLGRLGIFELLPISPTINQMILEREQRSTLAIEQQALREGMLSLRAAAWQRVLEGTTSIEEINRVIA
jgi:type IV pilus assembly protein PilB